MSKFAILGRKEFIFLFKIFDFNLYNVEKKEDLPVLVKQAINEGNEVIIIEEFLLQGNEDILNSYSQEVFPLIMPFSFSLRPLGLIRKMLSEASLKATGTTLLL